MKTAKIKFPAQATHTVGSLVEYRHPKANYWRIVKIENGMATAKAAGFGDPNYGRGR